MSKLDPRQVVREMAVGAVEKEQGPIGSWSL